MNERCIRIENYTDMSRLATCYDIMADFHKQKEELLKQEESSERSHALSELVKRTNERVCEACGKKIKEINS